MVIKSIKQSSVSWKPCYRIIPSRFPPIDLFERVTNAEFFDKIYEIEQLTNPRLREEVGDINLVPKEERIFGAGTSMIMAAFTHLPILGSRFSDGSYGVYYAGICLKTAIQETKFHRERFLKSFNPPKTELDMRVLLADLKAKLHDITGLKEIHSDIYHPDNYNISQQLAKELRSDGRASFGIIYDSIRYEKGSCAAIFRPKALTNCRQERHLCYVWDGNQITHIYHKQLVS